jgi:hypothetical protein
MLFSNMEESYFHFCSGYNTSILLKSLLLLLLVRKCEHANLLVLTRVQMLMKLLSIFLCEGVAAS